MTAPRIAALGNAPLDMEFRGPPALLHRARLRSADTVLAQAEEQQRRRELLQAQCGDPSVRSGGSAANSLVLAAGLGVRGTLMSIVGKDPEGKQYRHDLEQAGVRLVSPSGVTRPTASCLVLLTPDGERTMSTCLSCCEDIGVDTLDADSISASDWLLLEGYCLSSPGGREAMLTARELARAAGTSVALTLSSALLAKTNREALEQLTVLGIDLLIGNAREAQAASGQRNPEKALRALAEKTPRVAVTLSERGALFAENQHTWHQPTRRVEIQNALGTGDAFAGALLAALALGHGLHTAGEWGCIAGTVQVQCFGPRLDEPGRMQLSQLLLGSAGKA